MHRGPKHHDRGLGARSLAALAPPSALDAPNSQTLASAVERLTGNYATAYGVTRSVDPSTMNSNVFRGMRAYVRRWVKEWDLRRLHPDTVLDTRVEEIVASYEEDKDLQTESTEED